MKSKSYVGACSLSGCGVNDNARRIGTNGDGDFFGTVVGRVRSDEEKSDAIGMTPS